MMNTSWLKSGVVSHLVSVVVPLYNREKYVVGTLDSVLASTYRPLEVLVVNDGSTDCSAAVVRNWIDKLPVVGDFQVRLLEQPNRGPSAARNHGAQESRGEFIHFLDADDMVLPVWYEYAVRTMRGHQECGLVWAGWNRAETKDMQVAVQWCMANHAAFADAIEVSETPPYFWATLFRRSTLDLVGQQYEGVYPGEDTDYFLRILMYGLCIHRLPCTLFVYRQFPEQISRSHKWQTIDAFLRAIEHAEGTLGQVAMTADRTLRVCKQFAASFQSGVFWAIIGRHKDLVLRAGKGVKRHAAGLTIRHRVQLNILITLAALGWFPAAVFIGRLLYGRGSFTRNA